MPTFLNNPDIFERVISLSKSEQEDPIKVVNAIFSDYWLTGLRNNFIDMCEASLCSDSGLYNTPIERQRLIEYRDHIIKLLDAVFIIRERYKNGRTNRMPRIIQFFRKLRVARA